MAKLREASIPARWNRAHGQALQAMLAQEERGRGELARVLRQTSDGGAGAIRDGLTFGIAKLRRESRDRGRLALAAEFDQARQDGLDIREGRGTLGSDPRDFVRARVIADNTAARWGRYEAQGLDADAALGSHLDTIAITETAEAFNDERRIVLQQTESRTSGSMVLFEFWDAALDRRTCPVCERASGTFVLLGQGFPAGRPGGVHPRCRCNGTIIPLPFWYTREVETDGEFDYEAA